MKLEFENMIDFIKCMPKEANLIIRYDDKNNEVYEEIKIIEVNDSSIAVKNKDGEIKTIDILSILDIACIDKLKLVIDKEGC